jgi:hypothetical protein
MTMNGLIRISVTITIIEMMVAIGMGMRLEDIGQMVR